MKAEEKSTAKSLESAMKQQTGVIDKINSLIKTCKENNLMGDVTEDELAFLGKYTEALQKVCDTVNKLSKSVQEAFEKEEKAKQEASKKEEKKPTPKKEEPPKAEEGSLFDFSFDE